MITLLFFGLFDQASLYFIPEYDKIKSSYQHDREFVQSIEESVPKNSMIFQLPYDKYPGITPIHQMSTYDHLRCYLHSRSLKWSYGAMNGRDADTWQKSVASRPIKQMVKILSDKGFNGIYINKNGFTDDGKNVINKIEKILAVEPIVSNNNRLHFYSMMNYNNIRNSNN